MLGCEFPPLRMLARRSLPPGWHEKFFGTQGSRNEPSLATREGASQLICVSQNEWVKIVNIHWSMILEKVNLHTPVILNIKHQEHLIIIAWFLKVLGKLQWFPVTNSLTKGPFNQMDSEVVPLCDFLGFRHHHQLEGAGSYIIYLGFCQSYSKTWHHLTLQVCFGWCSLQFSHCLKARF